MTTATLKDRIGITSKQKLKTRVLVDGERVYLQSFSHEYGLAEFTACLRYSFFRHRLERVFITPLQQLSATEKFEIDLRDASDFFSVRAWTFKGLADPAIWAHFWCPIHRCPGFRFYVPRTSTNFVVSVSGIMSSITFDL